MGKPLVFSRCSDSERAAVEELIEEYHRGDIRSFDVLSVRVHQRIGIHVSKSTIRRIYQRMFGEEQKERCGREKENNERILAELFDQYKRGEKSSWRQMAIRAQEAGISTSKSTLFRRFKKEQDDDRVRSMTIGSIAKTDESEEQNEPFVERISLSRHLRATLLNVYEDGGLRQYSLIRGDISTGRQYYRCTRCAEWKKKRSEGKIAYISVVKGRIVSQSGAHHPSCEPLDENKVFAKAVDRQCRLDVRKEGTNPRLSYTKGIQRMMGTNLNACSYFPPWNTVRRAYYRHRIKGSGQTPSPSPTTSDSQGTVDGRVTEVIHGENG
ncbi:hypothetical protein Tcan_05479 [Toxocara canis]|uniref:RYYR-CCHC domain-containing protein n=1 Tax=Toxocara canis TaxID=6265 RepID=A0A0B2UWF1_TOXCA|nr:hypothetical protein Tcan_05479 [Toxocara canis]